MDSQANDPSDQANVQTNQPVTASTNNNAVQDDFPVEDYLNKDILEMMGVEDLPNDKKEEIYNKMMSTIHERVMARVVDSLSEEQFAKLKEILKENSEEKFAQFAEETGIDLPQIYSEEALIYKIEMVNLVKNSKNDNKEE